MADKKISALTEATEINSTDLLALVQGGETKKLQFDTFYETGEWTPSIKGNSTEGVASYSKREGIYTRIGNKCILDAIMYGTFTASPTGNPFVDGLPFTTSSTPSDLSVIGSLAAGFTTVSNICIASSIGRNELWPEYSASSLGTGLAFMTFGTNLSNTNFQLVLHTTYTIEE